MSEVLRATRASPVHLVVLVLIALIFAVGVYTSDRFATPLNLANVQDQMVALANRGAGSDDRHPVGRH